SGRERGDRGIVRVTLFPFDTMKTDSATHLRVCSVLAALVLSLSVAGTSPAPAAEDAMPGLEELERMTARFAPVDIEVDLSALPDNERQALARIIEAARVFDPLFLRQVWAGNEAMLLDLINDRSALGQARLHY